MGRIKSTIIKRTARTMIKSHDNFNSNFEDNKKIVNENYSLPDKGTRNKITGYITRLKKMGNVPKPRKQLT